MDVRRRASGSSTAAGLARKLNQAAAEGRVASLGPSGGGGVTGNRLSLAEPQQPDAQPATQAHDKLHDADPEHHDPVPQRPAAPATSGKRSRCGDGDGGPAAENASSDEVVRMEEVASESARNPTKSARSSSAKKRKA